MLKVILWIVFGIFISILGCLLAALFFGERKRLQGSDRNSRLARAVRASGVLLLLLIVTTLFLSYWIDLWFLLGILPVLIVSVGITSLSNANDSSIGAHNRLVTTEKYLAAKTRLNDKPRPTIRTRGEINNEVLGRLWNDPGVRMLTRDVDKIVPGHVSEGEIVVDYEHLMEAGYAGKSPDRYVRIGKFLIYRQVAPYRDYWLRFKMPRQGKSNLYSIFKKGQQK